MRTYLVYIPSQSAEGASLTVVKAHGHNPVVLQFGRLEAGPGADNNDLAECPVRYTRA